MKRGLLLAALAVLAVAAGLRLQHLSSWSLDGDELYSHYDVQKMLAGAPWPEGARSHPLGYLVMLAGVSLFGAGEGALRIFPALSGIAAVACLLFMRRDVIRAPAAIAAGAFAAISPWLVYHSQEARFYGPLMLCATLATLWALPGERARPRAAAVAWFAAMLCHTSALLLGPCLLIAQVRRRPSLRQLALALLLGGVAFTLWIRLGGGAVIDVVRAAVERSTLASYDAKHFVAGLVYNLGLGTCVLLLAGAVGAWRRREPLDRVLLCAALLPPAVLLLAALLGVSMQQRYAMASVPAALVLAGQGWRALSVRRVLFTGATALALLAPAPELLANLQCGDRADYRAAAAWIAGHVAPADLIVSDEHALLQLYLARLPGWEDARPDEENLTPFKLWSFARNRHEVWIVLKSNHMGGEYGATFMTWLGEHFDQVARLGRLPPPLARHDNTLLVFRRRARVTDHVPPPPQVPDDREDGEAGGDGAGKPH